MYHRIIGFFQLNCHDFFLLLFYIHIYRVGCVRRCTIWYLTLFSYSQLGITQCEQRITCAAVMISESLYRLRARAHNFLNIKISLHSTTHDLLLYARFLLTHSEHSIAINKSYII